MKKLLLYGLFLSLVFSLAACASKSAPSDADKDNQTDDLTQAISNVQQSETKETLTNEELIKVFEEAYIGIKVFTADEDFGIDFEYNIIESTAEALYPTKQLPADYKERYIDWRPLEPDTSDNQSDVYEEPSKQPENVPQENTNSNKNTGTSGYDSTASDGSTDNNPNGGSGNTSSGDNAGGSDAYPGTPLPGAKTPGEGTGWTGPNPQVTLEEGYPNGLPNIY